MLDVRKDNNYNIIEIKTDEGEFNIYCFNNSDLYWAYGTGRSNFHNNGIKEFNITKENFYIYNEFDKLYNAVKNNTPFINFNGEKIVDKKALYCKSDTHNLFKNETIEWHSDDYRYDEASVVSIKKDKDSYKVIFKKSKENSLFSTYSVRIRNEGSRYAPYNKTFLNMYRNLKEYDANYHQVHIEEYLHSQKQLSLKKEK